ncbi:MAG: ATP-NAD kinase family protein [Anaerolineales bacterium]
MMNKKKVGLIINPLAGIGGRVGLKGSDGEEIQKQALSLGAIPLSSERTRETLSYLKPIKNQFDLFAASNEMGATVAINEGYQVEILPVLHPFHTTAEDTIYVAQTMKSLGVDLILFAGGDGTARDIFNAIHDEIAVIGIPAGVKIFSAVFAINPRSAAMLVQDFIVSSRIQLHDAEVVDLDEESYRMGNVQTKLFGFLKIPYHPRYVQNQKVPTETKESYQIEAIAQDVIENLEEGIFYALGPGTIPNKIASLLGIEKTLVGIDLIKDRQLYAKDVNEKALVEILNSYKLKLIVTPIGGQGFVFGRGNQPFSPQVLDKLSKEDILIVSLIEKIHALHGRPLRVDTGSPVVDQKLSGYVKIITGYNERIIYQVAG